MYHLVLITCLVVVAFVILVFRHSVEIAYVLLAGFPTVSFVIAIVHECARGIQQFNHQLLHVAYDSSYALLLLGICLTLRAILRRKRMTLVLAATFIAGMPLIHVFTFQSY